VADPYEILQVSPTAHIDVIKAAYRALGRQSAFRLTPEEREARQRAIVDAYERIDTQEKREAYDAEQKERARGTFKPGRVEGEAMGALLVIIDSLLEMDGSLSAPKLRAGMFTDGYNNLDFLLGVKTLLAKELIEQVGGDDRNGLVAAYKLTDDAWTWVEAKRTTFPARNSMTIGPESPPAGILPVVEDRQTDHTPPEPDGGQHERHGGRLDA